ncbi:UNVERIFIED_CONTAM: hypothetical protein NCL1_01517 [Trichonephila clavipes]
MSAWPCSWAVSPPSGCCTGRSRCCRSWHQHHAVGVDRGHGAGADPRQFPRRPLWPQAADAARHGVGGAAHHAGACGAGLHHAAGVARAHRHRAGRVAGGGHGLSGRGDRGRGAGQRHGHLCRRHRARRHGRAPVHGAGGRRGILAGGGGRGRPHRAGRGAAVLAPAAGLPAFPAASAAAVAGRQPGAGAGVAAHPARPRAGLAVRHWLPAAGLLRQPLQLHRFPPRTAAFRAGQRRGRRDFPALPAGHRGVGVIRTPEPAARARPRADRDAADHAGRSADDAVIVAGLGGDRHRAVHLRLLRRPCHGQQLGVQLGVEATRRQAFDADHGARAGVWADVGAQAGLQVPEWCQRAAAEQLQLVVRGAVAITFAFAAQQQAVAVITDAEAAFPACHALAVGGPVQAQQAGVVQFVVLCREAAGQGRRSRRTGVRGRPVMRLMTCVVVCHAGMVRRAGMGGMVGSLRAGFVVDAGDHHRAHHAAGHVEQQVAVEDPFAGLVGGEQHVVAGAGRHRDRVLVRLAGGVGTVLELEEQAVQVHGVGHHGVVDEAQAHALAITQADGLGVMVAAAVDGPDIALHVAAQPDFDGARGRPLVRLRMQAAQVGVVELAVPGGHVGGRPAAQRPVVAVVPAVVRQGMARVNVVPAGRYRCLWRGVVVVA